MEATGQTANAARRTGTGSAATAAKTADAAKTTQTAGTAKTACAADAAGTIAQTAASAEAKLAEGCDFGAAVSGAAPQTLPEQKLCGMVSAEESCNSSVQHFVCTHSLKD